MRKFVIERVGDVVSYKWTIEKVLYEGKTDFQKVLIATNHYLGVFLMLDNIMQSSQWDEYIYHECMVHPAMVTCGSPQKVLLVGSAEGSATNEILKYPSLKELVWIEIDSKLRELCSKYLPYGKVNLDHRVSLKFLDAFEYLRTLPSDTRFDVVIFDLTEWNDRNPLSNRLFYKDVYQKIYNVLSEKGCFVTFCVDTSNEKVHFPNIPFSLKEIFPVCRVFHFFVPSFLTDFRFVLASKGRDPSELTEKEIKKETAPFIDTLKYYDHHTHKMIFSLPRNARRYMRTTF